MSDLGALALCGAFGVLFWLIGREMEKSERKHREYRPMRSIHAGEWPELHDGEEWRGGQQRAEFDHYDDVGTDTP